jgi:hypothetical protein
MAPLSLRVSDAPINLFELRRYILEASHTQDKPFIRPEDAHLNIGFSCVSYLNTAFSLLPYNVNEEDSALEILQGLHGLQGYANQYWHSHVITYMDLTIAKKSEIPEYLFRQLNDILKYRKDTVIENGPDDVCIKGHCSGLCNTARFASLRNFPGLACLVSSIETFRRSLKSQDWSQKSIDGKFRTESYLQFAQIGTKTELSSSIG